MGVGIVLYRADSLNKKMMDYALERETVERLGQARETNRNGTGQGRRTAEGGHRSAPHRFAFGGSGIAS